MTRISEVVLQIKAWADSHEQGQGMAEYGLILALVALVAVAALGPLGTAVRATLDEVAGAL